MFPGTKYINKSEVGGVSALYSINKWGKAFKNKSIDESIYYLKTVPKELLVKFGEIIYYKYNKDLLTEAQKNMLIKLGYSLKVNSNEVLIFKKNS